SDSSDDRDPVAAPGTPFAEVTENAQGEAPGFGRSLRQPCKSRIADGACRLLSRSMNLNRREFIYQSALASAAALVLPSMTSCSATAPQARVRRPDPSGRINLGVIGYGTIAFSTVPNFLADPRVQIVAV